MMNDPAAPERDDDRDRKSKRRPEGSQRLDAAPNAGASVAKPQGSEQAQSAGRDRGRPKLDDDAQPITLAFDGDEAQGPPDTSRTVEVPGREENGADAFPLGGRSLDGRRTSVEFGAALLGAMDTEDDALPNAAAAAASFAAPSSQALAAPPLPTTTLAVAVGGGANAARALAPAQNPEAIVAAFLATKTQDAVAALLVTVVAPSADDTDGQAMYAALTQLLSATADGTLRKNGQASLTWILTAASLTDESRGLAQSNQELVKRFMDTAEYEKKMRKHLAGKARRPKLTESVWLRAALVRLVEMLASRGADVVNETAAAEAEAKWADRVAAAKASRAALNALGREGDAVSVLQSLACSATELNASGRPFTSRFGEGALEELVAEAFEFYPYGSWGCCTSGDRDERFAAFEGKLEEFAARAPAADELVAMLNALSTKQSARMDDSEATQLRVHAAQLAAVANTASVGARPPELEPEWDVAGRLRARGERAAEESAPRCPMACHLGPLHPRHNDAIDASIDESGELQRRTLEEGRKAENQMFFAARDVPKPRSPEEMVASYRHSTAWNGSVWVEGGGSGEATRARAAALRTRGAPAARPDEGSDSDLL